MFEAAGGSFEISALGRFDSANDYVYAYRIHNNGSTVKSSLQLTLGDGGFFSDLGEDAAADLSAVAALFYIGLGVSRQLFFASCFVTA